MRWYLRRGIPSWQFCGEWCNVVWCNVSEKKSLHPEEGSSRSIRTVGIYEQTEWCNIHDENISLFSSQHRGTRPESKVPSSRDSCRTHWQKQNVSPHIRSWRTVSCKPATYSWPEYLSTAVMTCLRLRSAFVHSGEDDVDVMTDIPSGNKYNVSRANNLTAWPTTTF